MPVVRRLSLPADPLQLARSLSERPGVALAWSQEGQVAYLACDPVELATSLDPEPQLARRAVPQGDAPRWFGYVPYDACRAWTEGSVADTRPEPLVGDPLWLRYAAVARVTQQVEIIGDDEAAAAALTRCLQRPPRASAVKLSFVGTPEPAVRHRERIEQALLEIARGNVYEVNLARRFDLSAQGTPWDILASLGRGGMPPQAMALRWGDLGISAASPELCVALEPHGRVLTSPIKGTRPRHVDPEEDARLARELDADPKERAELTMILDVERNDLGRVARIGSVRLLRAPHTVAWPDVHHRLATLEAYIDDSVSREALLRSVLPSGSVTGAPKRRAMQLIAELEPRRRGLYTGALGYVRRDGGLELAMAIRTLVVRADQGHYYTGGGIVADSDPDREVQETLWKASRLLALVQV